VRREVPDSAMRSLFVGSLSPVKSRRAFALAVTAAKGTFAVALAELLLQFESQILGHLQRYLGIEVVADLGIEIVVISSYRKHFVLPRRCMAKPIVTLLLAR